jgi:hypothetical protein
VNTENVVKSLRVLWRTDRIIADIRMRHLLVGLGLRAFAALIAAFGLLMLELSAYFALVQIWSAIVAAAVLGAVNFAIAAMLFALAGRPPAGRARRILVNPTQHNFSICGSIDSVIFGRALSVLLDIDLGT